MPEGNGRPAIRHLNSSGLASVTSILSGIDSMK